MGGKNAGFDALFSQLPSNDLDAILTCSLLHAPRSVSLHTCFCPPILTEESCMRGLKVLGMRSPPSAEEDEVGTSRKDQRSGLVRLAFRVHSCSFGHSEPVGMFTKEAPSLFERCRTDAGEKSIRGSRVLLQKPNHAPGHSIDALICAAHE